LACRRFLIRGRVQGVWFRASTRDEARRLGIAGHAVNLPDGRVEVLACGSDAALQALAAWLRRGPPLAEVEEVLSEELAERPVSGFITG